MVERSQRDKDQQVTYSDSPIHGHKQRQQFRFAFDLARYRVEHHTADQRAGFAPLRAQCRLWDVCNVGVSTPTKVWELHSQPFPDKLDPV